MSKQVYKLPPCPAWQTDTLERWLEDQAAEGLILSRDGFMLGFGTAAFEASTPKKMRFRLEPAELPVGILADGEPDKVEFHTDLGWDYHETYGQYHIYSTADPTAPELHTDPEIQAYTIEKAKKRLRSNLINLIIWLLLMPIIRNHFQFLRAFLAAGTPVLLAFGYVWLTPLIRKGRELLYLRRKVSAIRSGEERTNSPDPDWRRRTIAYNLRRVFSILCILLVVWGMFWYADVLDKRKIYLPDYDGNLPFPTMCDLAGTDSYVPLFKNDKRYDYVQFMSDILAPTIIHFHQTGDAGPVDGGMTVEYYELRFPWMARQLAWEYKIHAKRQAAMSRTREYTELRLPPLDVEYAEAFVDIFPSVVMYEGNKLIYVYFYQTTPKEIPLDEWVLPFAEVLQAE